jgi:hypothetical protein
LSAAASDYKYQEASFGLPLYGESISLPVYYTDSEDLCHGSAVKTDVGYPERPVDKNGTMPSWPTCILMVDRGGCSFITKARNAMYNGAAVVIIADSSCMCSDEECVNTYPEDVCQQTKPNLADDGSSDAVTIPSLFLARLDADAIKDTLKENTEVKMVLDWKGIPQTEEQVEYNIWMTPVTDLSAFRKIAMALGDRVKFTPQMWISDGLLGGCRSYNAVKGCAAICTNDGRYCASSDNRGILGSSIVEESLRRVCIWKIVGDLAQSFEEMWWDYTYQFQKRCMSSEQFNNTDCINDCYQRSGLDHTLISGCMQNSGGLESNATNPLLEAQLDARKEAEVVDVPALFVNNVTILGQRSAVNLFRAICAGYKEGSAPEICTTCFDPSCSDPVSCASTESCEPSEETEGGDGGDGNDNDNGKPSDNSTSDHQSATTKAPDDSGSSVAPINNYDTPTGGGLLVDILSSLAGTYDGIQECDVDLGQVASSAASLISQPSGDGAMALANLDEECLKKAHFKFVRALDHFHSCAGWSIQEVIETLPSAMVGSLIRCADLFAANDDNANDISANAAMEECITPILGDNPIGEALRGMYLEPDRACPCLQAFSHSVPKCKLAVWPVPLVGSWIKKTTCLMASLGCGSIESFCLGELQALDTCLPKDDETKSCEPPLLCSEAANSVSLSIPSSMLGIPLPDACIRIYEDQKNTTFAGTNVVARYQIFQKYCRAKQSIWDADPKSTAASDGYTEKLQVDVGKASDETDVGVEASSGFGSLTSTTGFQLGIASGIGIALILGIFTVIARMAKGGFGSNKAEQKGKYKQIELVEC